MRKLNYKVDCVSCLLFTFGQAFVFMLGRETTLCAASAQEKICKSTFLKFLLEKPSSKGDYVHVNWSLIYAQFEATYVGVVYQILQL